MRRVGTPRTAPLKRAAALAAFAVSGVVAAVAAIVPSSDAELLLAKAAVLEPVAIRADEALLPAPASYVREDRLQRADTLEGLLARLAVGDADAQKLLRQRELRLLRPGEIVTAEVRAEGELVWLSFLAPRDMVVRIERVGESLVSSEQRAQLAARNELKAALVESSLFAAADAAGTPDAVAIQLAEVFGSDIDFHRELRKGDRFSVLYEMLSVAGRPLRAGSVLAAEFANQGRTHRAVSHAGGYYAPDGKIKAFGRGIRSGARVAQGDTVGLIGQTGWATGPRLHYEFRVAGAARNPLCVPLPAGAPVARHDMGAFRARAQPLFAQLKLLADSQANQVAALE